MQLIKLRGGLETLFHSTEYMRPALLYLMVVGVMGNTTSPPSQQIHITSQNRILPLIEEMYGEGLFPALLCPPQLFIKIAEINQFRYETDRLEIISDDTRDAAHRLLEDIERFAPQDWSDSAPNNQEDWLVLGSVYQSAVLIYCIASLQSLSVLPSTSELNATRAAHGHSLLNLLKKALLLPQMRKCMLWPLVVAGMETGRAAAPSRQFVGHELRIMSQDLGTPIASSANTVLQRFWSSGKDTWDDCFDRPCAFVT
ncbi:predicted protein [Aspergillus terreus NIH2624]|uniref:Transcription factor domain-containing protein n=1 Tax=Aspergillus terreus (strain NIH 2624 / FGSC A1156) TaxID=341663 RepID=Q0CS02_ASPTN|nr:uncharacterized protein ATEG_03532 [Aspergillus terreus NIH2624]EAU36806.1 predicted protein [Aspergillus terreus NIH2624]